MTHPGDVPEEVVSRSPCSWTFAAASRATCTEREKTRLEHQWEIARQVGYRDFVDVEAELAVWIDDRAWTTGEGPVAVFNGAVGLAWRARGAAARGHDAGLAEVWIPADRARCNTSAQLGALKARG
jgi:2-keto-4-pentenoate hydratase/2-oxohepta-3-ene-1,7-dioic acid hydratase in catechol pathway